MNGTGTRSRPIQQANRAIAATGLSPPNQALLDPELRFGPAVSQICLVGSVAGERSSLDRFSNSGLRAENGVDRDTREASSSVAHHGHWLHSQGAERGDGTRDQDCKGWQKQREEPGSDCWLTDEIRSA
jgi:hypothetical protein